MNKLYVFCALVFLTACGSPDLDGSWVGVGACSGFLPSFGSPTETFAGDSSSAYSCW